MRQTLVKAVLGIVILLVGIYLGKYNPSIFSISSVPTPTSTGMNPVSNTPSVTGPQGVTGMTLVNVTRVIDGDTIDVTPDGEIPERSQRVRYIGIDTPETVKPNTPTQCFGKEASAKNKELILGKKVKLEKDVSETDKYGRLLRYVWVGDIFVNDYLVRNGYAQASTYPPDVRYQNQFAAAQKEAQENQKGLWAPNACTTPTPSASVQSALDPRESCNIKGNVSSSGEKIYHMPWQQYYDKTQIDENAGERWFCTEEEAISSGWRKSKV
ncbi:MAG: thermonuclease family protein [Candidatus Blackburnbacteria bacterium]|nr:thermonuclease family protein [Candidatus Blackburnbacteria bacterium]